MCSDAPDTSGINAAAVDSAALGHEALDFYKGEVQRTQGQRDQAAQTAQEVSQAQLETMKTQNDLAKDYADYNKTTYRPLEQQIVKEAQAYDTPERQQAAADQATADVRAASNRATASTARTLARMGYDPTVDATQAAVDASRAEAGAATGARRTVEATGRALRSDAANMGRGLASSQATAIQTGTNAGTAAVGAAGSGVNINQSGAGLMQAGYSTALQGNQTAGSLYSQQANIQQQASGMDLGGLGSLAAGGAKLYSAFGSDKNIKKKTGRMMDTAEALEELNDHPGTDNEPDEGEPTTPADQLAATVATPVHKGWQYDPAKGGPDDGGQPHDGPMAQDVQRNFGGRAAPRGRMIDPITMNGHLMGAVQQLAKQDKALLSTVQALSKQVKGLSARMGAR
jgi:hypothetical protein